MEQSERWVRNGDPHEGCECGCTTTGQCCSRCCACPECQAVRADSVQAEQEVGRVTKIVTVTLPLKVTVAVQEGEDPLEQALAAVEEAVGSAFGAGPAEVLMGYMPERAHSVQPGGKCPNCGAKAAADGTPACDCWE